MNTQPLPVPAPVEAILTAYASADACAAVAYADMIAHGMGNTWGRIIARKYFERSLSGARNQ